MKDRAIVLFAHGARDPEWAQPIEAIRRAIIARQAGVDVEFAFLEYMEPPLADAIAKLVKTGHKRITVAPLFIAQGGHLKNDLPKILDAIRAEHRGVEITLLPAIGEVDAIVGAIADWLVASTVR